MEKSEQENKKYYSPVKEEFHYGFEYEWKRDYEEDIDENWKEGDFSVSFSIDYKKETGWVSWDCNDNIIRETDVDVFHILTNLDRPHRRLIDLRVKYLDKEDIESCLTKGSNDFTTQFKFRTESKDELIFQTYWLEEGEFLDEDYVYWNTKYNNFKITHKSKTLFWGKIQNKSEFQQILKMINI